MRKILWVSLMSATIATTGACKKREERNYEGASKAVEKTKEQVKEQGKEVGKEVKEVTKEPGEQAQGELAKARVDYLNTTRTRLANIDTKLDELSRMTSDKARTSYTGLKQRRDLLADRVHDIETRNADIPTDVRKDIDSSFDKLEKDVSDAL